MKKRGFLILVLIGSFILLTGAFFGFKMIQHHNRVRQNMLILHKDYGSTAYRMVSGQADRHPVLVVHGSGGGLDQAEIIASLVAPKEYSWVLPSRFGYPGSAINDNLKEIFPKEIELLQARAYVDLIKSLGYEKVHIIAMSAGGSTALRFAIEYPEMTASLTLLSCGIRHFDLSEDTEARARAEKLVKILGSDFIFWSLSGIFRQTIAGFAGVPRDVFSHLNPDEKKAGMNFIKFMNPASIRRDGILIDQFQPRPDSDIASINAPTLIIHAEDDGIQQYQNALFAFDLISDSQFLSFEKGGHMVMVTEREKIKNALKDHLEQAERDEGL